MVHNDPFLKNDNHITIFLIRESWLCKSWVQHMMSVKDSSSLLINHKLFDVVPQKDPPYVDVLFCSISKNCGNKF